MKNLMMISSYFNSRMIGEYVYEVISQLAYMIYDTIVLPKITLMKESKILKPRERSIRRTTK